MPNNELTFQSLRQKNIIKAQDFIYENQNIGMIIAGSSLSGRIVLSQTGIDIYDLSFSGLGPVEGINILLKTNSHPNMIFVETNFIDRELSNEFGGNFFNPVRYQMLKHINSLRLKNQPLNYLSSFKFFLLFRSKFSNFINNFSIRNFAINSASLANGNKSDSVIYDKAVRIAIDRFQKVPDEKRLNKFLVSIKSNLDQLAKNGTRIVFFEMPMHPEISDSPYANLTRQSVRKVFSDSEYAFLNTPDPHDFQTTDGYHLDKLSAEKYTIFFTAELSKII